MHNLTARNKGCLSDERPASVWRGALIIFSVWLFGVAILAIGTYTKSSIGFLWPMGQDIDWSIILKQGVGALAAQQEFSFDHRNPLSGWIYSLAAPLILGHEYGFHFLRLLTCLFLGISVYLLAFQLGRRRTVLFPTVCGTIISIWWFWSNYTQVVWLMLLALAASVLIVWLFCLYVDSGRTKGIYCAYGLALWLLVLGTYTIQWGAIIPMFLIAWLRNPDKRLLRASNEMVPFAFTAACFAMIWVAAAGPFFADASIRRTTGFDFSISQASLSAVRFIWHPSFSHLSAAAKQAWSPGFILFVIVCALAVVASVASLAGRVNTISALRESAVWTVLTLMGLAAPTLLLESTSPTWVPGTRSEMMFSAFIPTICIGTTVLLFSRISMRATRAALIIVGSILAASVLIMNLEQNRQGTEAMIWQKNLALPLRQVLAARSRTTHFVVINRSSALQVGADFGARFAQDKIGRVQSRWTHNFLPNETSMRFIETTDAPPGFPGAWRVEIGQKTVKGALYGLHDEVSRDSVVVVDFDGVKARILDEVTLDDLKGMQATIK